VLSIFTGGGFLSSLVFGKISGVTKRFSASVALVLLAIGMLIMATATSLTMLVVGSTIAGLGSGIWFPSVMMLMGQIAPPAVIGGAVGLAMASMKLASFFCTYYMAALAGISGTKAVQFPILVASIGFALLAIFFIVTNWKPKAVPAAQQG